MNKSSKSQRQMDCMWLKVDENEDSYQKPCFGVFTCDPALIASRLPRPSTPFIPQNKVFPISTNKSESLLSKNISLESPIATDAREVFKFRSQPLISVF